MRPRIGLSVMPLETRREAIVGLATEGDRLGYDGFFLPETWAYDITVLLAEAAARTTRITLGTGILGIWNRSAATIAMVAALRFQMPRMPVPSVIRVVRAAASASSTVMSYAHVSGRKNPS